MGRGRARSPLPLPENACAWRARLSPCPPSTSGFATGRRRRRPRPRLAGCFDRPGPPRLGGGQSFNTTWGSHSAFISSTSAVCRVFPIRSPRLTLLTISMSTLYLVCKGGRHFWYTRPCAFSCRDSSYFGGFRFGARTPSPPRRAGALPLSRGRENKRPRSNSSSATWPRGKLLAGAAARAT